ncbi:MurR/RpiR family transcriptional regulator [Facklamia sp. P12945]|uniref:MurR/RpiR family transcriptional regulator n=1 Tax=unclassified Facklamia TaxID=2622293 RepID=UPI003D171508
MYQVINQLQERNFAKKISQSEKVVLDYLENHFASIPNQTVLKIAQETYTSQATINRTCKLLGFKGFSELKYAVQADINLQKRKAHSGLTTTESAVDLIDFASLADLAGAIYTHRHHLMLFGLGASGVTARYMARQLIYLGIPVVIISEIKMLEHFHNYSLLVLSSSGETQRCLQVIEKAKAKKMTVFAITKKDSSVMKASKLSFYHDVQVNLLDGLSREQQVHMILMVNETINYLKSNYLKLVK